MLKKTGILSQNALAFTMIGAVVVGALSAVLAFAPFHFSAPGGNSQAQTSQNAASGGSQQGAATASPQTSATLPSTATAVSPRATATAKVPPPTSTPTTTLRGTVASVNTATNQFVVRQFNGTVTTVVVTSQTTYQNLASSLDTMTVGWRVRVTGSFQADGTWKALNVYAYIDH